MYTGGGSIFSLTFYKKQNQQIATFSRRKWYDYFIKIIVLNWAISFETKALKYKYKNFTSYLQTSQTKLSVFNLYNFLVHFLIKLYYI